MRTLVKELKEKVGQEVMLYLTLDVLRDQKHLQFILAHDKSGSIQLVVSKKSVVNHGEISTLLQGSVFSVKGRVQETTQSKTFGIEVHIDTLEIMSKAQVWPIAQDSAIDLRFDNRGLDLRFPRQQLMLKIRSAFIQGCRQFLSEKGMTEVQTSKFLSRASESGSEVFTVDYFGKKAYLAQSPQQAKQMLAMSGLESVYEVNFVYRAEKSTSSRHLSEFTGIDVEYAFVFDVKELMEMEEAMMRHALMTLTPFKYDVKELFGIELTTEPSVAYMTLDEAKAILKENGVMSLGKKMDLPDEGERMLYEIVKKDLIFISDYPIEKRPFYHMYEPEKGTTKSFDLIFKGVEITSGAIREYRLDVFEQQVKDKGVSLQSVESYIELFKFGSCPHGGWGLGVERVIAKLLGITVKESAILPRDCERITP